MLFPLLFIYIQNETWKNNSYTRATFLLLLLLDLFQGNTGSTSTLMLDLQIQFAGGNVPSHSSSECCSSNAHFFMGTPLLHTPICGPSRQPCQVSAVLRLLRLMPWRKGPLIPYYLPHTEPFCSNCISKILPLNLIVNAFISHNLLFKNCKHTEKFKEWNNKHWYSIQLDLTIVTSAFSVPRPSPLLETR